MVEIGSHVQLTKEEIYYFLHFVPKSCIPLTYCCTGTSAKMTNDDEQQQLKIESVQNLIAELCVSAPSEDIKQCLRTYKYGKTLSQLEKDFNKFRKNILESTLSYLKVENQEQFIKSANTNSLICRLQNLLPEECILCKETYCIKTDDAPLLVCAFCGQEVHRKCYLQLLGASTTDYNTHSFHQAFNPLNLPGLHYVCKPCELIKIPQDNCGRKSKFSKPKGTTQRDPMILTQQTQRDPIMLTQQNQDPLLPDPDLPLPDPDQPLPDPNTSLPDPDPPFSDWHIQGPTKLYPDLNKINSTNFFIDDKEEITNNEEPNTKKVETKATFQKICRFFIKGNCRYGLKGRDCPYTHPKICRKLLSHGTRNPRGCNLGKRCQDFHPKMCPTSITKSFCYENSCNLKHVRGTRRNPPESDITESNET